MTGHTYSRTKGDSRHGAVVKRLLVLSLLAGCGHGGVTLSVPQQEKLTALAHRAQNECQRHCNLSDENACPEDDDACLNLARTWLGAAK